MKSFKITQSITDRQDASLGIFFKEVSKLPLIDVDKEVELAKRAKEGDIDAANELVKANLRFVISVAKQYQNKGLPLIDLIQEGICGLIEASKRFNADKGFKFISYAVWWIKQSIIYALSNQSRTVRIPMNQVVAINKINKASEKLEQELARTPSIEELALETEMFPDKINLTLSSTNKALSLDMPFKDDEVGCLLDIIPNENSIVADNNIIQENISEKVESVIKQLSNREGDVIRMSFGLGMAPMTLEEIACRFGIGSERVRQIQYEALENLKFNYGNILKRLL